MKRITLKHTIRVLGSNDHGSEAIDKEAYALDNNKKHVFNTYASIESYMNLLIVHEFIGEHSIERAEQIEKFKSKILHTSWFGFSQKLTLVLDILDSEESIDMKRTNLESLLRKIMDYRNMLAHGEFYTDGKISELRYYKSGHKIQLLDDEFWGKVEENYSNAFKMFRDLLFEKKILKELIQNFVFLS